MPRNPAGAPRRVIPEAGRLGVKLPAGTWTIGRCQRSSVIASIIY